MEAHSVGTVGSNDQPNKTGCEILTKHIVAASRTFFDMAVMYRELLRQVAHMLFAGAIPLQTPPDGYCPGSNKWRYIMAKNTKTAAKPATTERRVISPTLKAMENHTAEVTGGRKYDLGTKVDVLSVYVSRYGKDQARIQIGDDIGYIDPKFLKKGKPLPAAQVAKLEAEREEQNTPVLILGRVVRMKDAEGEKSGAVMFDTPSWLRPVWFSLDHFTMIHKFEDGEHEGKMIAEAPAWKIKQGAGKDALDALMGKQDTYAKLAGLNKAAA